MLPLEEAHLAKARYGELLILRDERPMSHRGIVLPSRARNSSRSQLARVWSVGEGVHNVEAGLKVFHNDAWEVRGGTRLLLSGGAGKKVYFGERRELALERWLPSNVLCSITGGEDLEVGERHPLSHYTPSEAAVDIEEVQTFDEGDPRAIQ
jgi:co-chaperonin GroES (HSP10)